MEWWTKIRLEVSREESSKREILRRESIGWDTLKKILAHPEPPGYCLKEPRPKRKIGPYLERIAQIIEEDKTLPKKQRHTAKRIYERIRQLGYTGKYTQVKEAVREFLRVRQEVFMPLVHRPVGLPLNYSGQSSPAFSRGFGRPETRRTFRGAANQMAAQATA